MGFTPQYLYAVNDFFEVTHLLEYGDITGQIKDIIHPGESDIQDHSNLLACLDKLSEVDKVTLLKSIIMNDILGVREFSVYDWGYWVDHDGMKHAIPYSLKRQRSLMCDKLGYRIYGQLPTIELLLTNCHDFVLQSVVSEVVYAIESWQKDLHKRLTTNCTGFLELDEKMQKGLQSLKEAY